MEDKKFFQARGSPTIMVDIPAEDLLEKMDNFFFPSMYCGFFNELRNILGEVMSNDHPTRQDLARVKDALRYLPEKSPERMAANNIYFKISKLQNAQVAMLTEGYQAFEAQAAEIACSSKKYCMELASDSGFKNMRRLSQTNIRQHPKIVKLLELANILKQRDQIGVIFVESEATAVLLYQLLKEIDQGTEIVLAEGANHSGAATSGHKAFVAEQLRKRALRFTITESRLQGLVMMDEVDRYIQYSIPKPYLAYSTLALRWDNRWNKRIYHLLLNHPVEIQSYWDAYYKGQFPALHRAEKKLQRQTLLGTEAAPSPKPQKYKKGKGGNSDQLKLFGD